MQAAVPFLIFLAVFALLWGLFFLVAPRWLGAGWEVTRRVARRLTRRDVDTWVVWVVGLGTLLLAALAGAFFLEIAERIQEETPEIDRLTYEWFRGSRRDAVTPFFVTFTIIGKPGVLGILVLIVSLALLPRRRYGWIAYLALVSIGGGIVGAALKAYFSRARPDLGEAIMEAAGYAFPSGHALGSTIVFGSLAYVAVRAFRTWTARSAALALAATSVAAVCLSRLYLGVHWLSDIAGGVSAGIVWLTATTAAYEVLRRMVRMRRARRIASSG
jgi:membrane-associated phospholipid phosphatase